MTTFSIIMPAYNAEDTIINSVDSVLEQTFSDFELIIVNDCSTDSTRKIIENIADSRIRLINNTENCGVAESRNIGLGVILGKYVAFLDSDDLWHPTKLEKQFSLLESGINVVCSNYIAFTEKPEAGNIRVSPENIDYKDMLKSNFVGNLTGAYNVKALGVTRQRKVGHEDYVMWLEIIRKSNFCYCIQEELAFYRVSKNSLSSNKIKALKWQWEIYRNILNMPFFSSLFYFACYSFYAVNKRLN